MRGVQSDISFMLYGFFRLTKFVWCFTAWNLSRYASNGRALAGDPTELCPTWRRIL